MTPCRGNAVTRQPTGRGLLVTVLVQIIGRIPPTSSES